MIDSAKYATVVSWEEGASALLESVIKSGITPDIEDTFMLMARQADRLVNMCLRLGIKDPGELEELIAKLCKTNTKKEE